MSVPDSPLGDSAFPLRPTHPDFARMVTIVLRYDAAMDTARGQKAKDAVFSKLLAEVCDADSLAYMAMQRAMRVCGVTTRADLVTASSDVSKLAGVYMEGFLVGAQFQALHR